MIQIAYQPAYDPYHTAFRLLRLSAVDPARSFKIDQLRILDFYLAFPSFASSIRGVKAKVKSAGLDDLPEEYGELPSAITVFHQMAPIQDAAIQTLCVQGILDFDKETFLQSELRLSKNGIPEPLSNTISKKNKRDKELIDFLFNVLLEIPLEGTNGLKDRTRLLEHRYDFV